MHYFELRNFQHFMLYLLPTLLFVVLFGIGLSYMHFKDKDSGSKLRKILWATWIPLIDGTINKNDG